VGFPCGLPTAFLLSKSVVQWAWGRGVSNVAALFIVGLLAGDGEGWFGGRPRVSFRDDA